VDELVDAEVGSIWGRVSLIDPDSALEWLIPAPFAMLMADVGPHPGGGRRVRPSVVASVEVEPDRVGPAGVPLESGHWAVVLRWRGLSIGRAEPLRPGPGAKRIAVLPAVLGDPPRLVLPRLGEEGLTVEVGGPGLEPGDLPSKAPRMDRDGSRFEATLPIATTPRTGRIPAVLVLHLPGGERTWPAEARPDLGRLRVRSLEGGFGTVGGVDDEEAPLSARLGSPLNVEVQLGRARLAGDGRIEVAGAANEGPMTMATRRTAWRARTTLADVRGRVRDGAVNLAVRLPHPMRLALVGAYRAVRSRRG
jgi:hypothetical protein